MDQATLDNVPKVRLATNQWLMDCMYYFSKPYGQFIINAICRQCNEAYHHYGNPKHVHMIGFSLGGVAAYDILSTQWNHNDMMDEPTATTSPTATTTAASSTDNNDSLLAPSQKEHESCFYTTAPDICAPKLDFEVEHLFTCGSPLAAALIFRGLDYMNYRPPSCTRIHNIFHPYDPLGYRLEPMINSNFIGVSPVRLARAPPRKRRLLLLPKIPDLGIKTFITNYMMLNNNNTSSDDEMKDTTTTTTATATTITILEEEEEDNDEFVVQQEMNETIHNNHHHEQEGQTTIEQEEITNQEEGSEEFYPQRIDYMLTETVIDTYASEWIIAIKSHFRYWANRIVG
ncbi:hypothetical protein INT45_003487 [Circinella minor]|uniref:DDHD domain-containing protein n=1 Tax=Circinella minor TaxID=1195481 RepID=A0A8H7VP89_9FUNG|nr:hypothetical protein INT45_003487 [Circinella minor]